MRTAWGLLAFVLLAGCGSKKDNSPIIREEEIPPPKQPEPPKPAPPSIDDELMNNRAVVDPAPTAAVPDPKAECVDAGSPVVSFDPAKLRACFDTNHDTEADRCVTWRRDGKVAAIDTMFAVEDPDAKEPAEPAIEYRSDEENNEDQRITNDGNQVEICPYDRACMTIMPKVGEGELEQVLTDADYKHAVFLTKDYDNQKGMLEMWDLASGRMRARVTMKRLVTGETYDFSMHLGSGVVIAIASDSDGRALGTIYGLDGGFRGELAQGSRNLDADTWFQHAGVLGVVDVGPYDSDEKPYVLYLHSLANGGALGKFSIKRVGELTFHAFSRSFVAVMQWGEQLRIDMIDLRARTNRVLFAPRC